MAKVKAVKLGPFKGGLNNVGEVSTIDPSQLSILSNFDIDNDGSLVSRPPIVPEAPTAGGSDANSKMRPLGYYVRSDGETFLVATNPISTFIYQLSTKTWQQIWDKVASAFVQYDNKIVMCSETVAGGYWEAGTFTATSSMPLMSQIVTYGERFWGFGPKGTTGATTVYFSNITVISPAQSIYDWQPTSNFFTVDKGDGQWLTAIVSDPNALLIFRNGSTYQFTYPSSPINGTLRRLNTTIGADNRASIGKYENYYLVLNQGFLYQFINYLYYPRNEKIVRFQTAANAAGVDQSVALSIFGQRAIVYYYGSLYVYNIVQGVWSMWNTTTLARRFLQVPQSSVTGDTRTALVVNGDTTLTMAKQGIMRITEGVLIASVGEEMTCYARTKAYTLDLPGMFKRLMYWAISFRSSRGLVATATPLDIIADSTTWNQMNATTWNVLNKGTWNNLLIIIPTLIDNITFPTASPVQGLAKAKAALRFKSIYFDLQLSTDGTSATAPARIFELTAYLSESSRAREKVS